MSMTSALTIYEKVGQTTHIWEVTLEQMEEDCARLAVSYQTVNGKDDGLVNLQGIDLEPNQLRALSSLLLAAAEMVEQSPCQARGGDK